jgi:hypothetical protein
MATKEKLEYQLKICFDVDYPLDVDNPFVGSLFDIYSKGFKSGYSFKHSKSLKIIDLTDEHIEILASTWTLKKGYGKTVFTRFLKEVKQNVRELESFPLFIIKAMEDLGYETI